MSHDSTEPLPPVDLANQDPDKISRSSDLDFRCPHCSELLRYHGSSDYEGDYTCPSCSFPIYIKVADGQVKIGYRIRKGQGP